ncbi:MAG: hypothetical protein R2681_12780 [Pyrinomonadaceae bacterium]
MRSLFERSSAFLLLVLAFLALTAQSCGLSEDSPSPLDVFEADDTEAAIELIDEANRNLKSIRVLYNQNNSKVDELTKALQAQDIEKVRKLTDDLSLIINDGYVFAESAKEKIGKAQTLNINADWKDYLRLKEMSLDMQIKAFDFRRESAKLFRDKFGGADKLQMAQAADTFKKNEENFAKYIAQAEELNKQADELAKDVEKK